MSSFENDSDIREMNISLAEKIMHNFGRNMEGWYDNLHEKIVMEFPFGPSIGMPARVEGKEGCSAVFATVCELLKVKFQDINITPMLDPNTLVLEYRGIGDPEPGRYDQTYICIQKYQDSKMILFREYWNAKVAYDLFGDLSSLG